MNTKTLRGEVDTLLEELKEDRDNYRNKNQTVQEAGKSIGYANATGRAIKTGLDIERFEHQQKMDNLKYNRRKKRTSK